MLSAKDRRIVLQLNPEEEAIIIHYLQSYSRDRIRTIMPIDTSQALDIGAAIDRYEAVINKVIFQLGN